MANGSDMSSSAGGASHYYAAPVGLFNDAPKSANYNDAAAIGAGAVVLLVVVFMVLKGFK